MNRKTMVSRSILVFFSLILSGTLGASAQIPKPGLDVSQISSYEGQNVTSVEVAGRPDLPLDRFNSVLAPAAGEPFSLQKAQAAIQSLKAMGPFQDVHLDVRPEPEGVRILYVAQPAVYFGMYDFDKTGPFSYARLLQASNYASKEPYSAVDIRRAENSLLTFLQRNGYFEATVESEVKLDSEHGLANVLFHLTLNKQAKFGEVRFTGTSDEDAAELRSALRSLKAILLQASIRSGKKYSLKKLQNAVEHLERTLAKQKHLAAQVRLAGAEYNPKTRRADITFEVKKGPVVDVRVEGARVGGGTREKLLPIYQQVGLTPELIQEGRQNLIKHFESKGFFDVTVDSDVQSTPSGETVRYKIAKGPRKKIVDVEFRGNDHFDEDDLEDNVAVEKARLLSKGKYDEKSEKMLEAIYRAAGFNQVKVTTQFETHDGHMDVIFLINEGPQDTVESLRIEGNTVPQNQFAPDGLRISPGQPFSQKNVDDDRNKITAYYLDHGYLTANLRETATPVPGNPNRFNVVYSIYEGPQVHTENVAMVGRNHTQPGVIAREITSLQPGMPLTERNLLASESRLYTRGVFDWAEIDTRRPITDQTKEVVVVKLHEARRNSLTWGLGFEMTNRGGSVPTGTIAVPGLPVVGVSSDFKVSQRTYRGPRASILYTRSNVRGKAETITLGALGGPLIRRLSFAWANPNFRWTGWSSNYTSTGEINKENPIFSSRLAQVAWQLQRPLDEKQTKVILLRYSLTQTGLTELVLPDLIPEEDRHTRLSTFSASFIHDTRDNILDARKGNYQSFQLDFNSRLLGSNVSFAKLLFQTAYYHPLTENVVWANSVRVGLEQSFGGSHVPISERFFTGGGSTLRGFPLNGAGPQRTIPACNDPADPSTCSLIRVPVGGAQLLIINSEFRMPLPLKKGLSLATFYDGGNVFHPVGFQRFRSQYTNSVGLGFRYATPVGPIRVDFGRNLNRIDGIKATQIFITLGQAF
jgi:outer membrane protein insertion porin family